MNELRGTGMLLATNLRRDKFLLPLCVATFAAVAASSAVATADVYPDLASQVQGADLINSTPALVAMYGPIYDPTSLGAVSVFKIIGLGTALVGLFAALVVIRHTRADEELGRYELLAGGSIGRFASLAAALSIAGIGVVGIGVFTAVGLAATGLPVAGSLAFGLSWTVAGLAFAGVGAVAAQLTASARAARGLAVGGLAIAYLLRAVGDANGNDRAELAELAVADRMGAADPTVRGGPLAARPTATGIRPRADRVGHLLIRHRDIGSGLLPQRRGPARAGCSSPLRWDWPGGYNGRRSWAGWRHSCCSASWSHRSSPGSATCSARQWPAS